MGWETLFVMALGGVEVLIMFILSNHKDQITRLQEELSKTPMNFVLKEDYRSDIKDVKDKLDRVLDKLEKKADKS